MQHAFALFAARGLAHVDLKVDTDEEPARRLYARLGMVEVSR
ncbi:ribosomal protein S18 acetylase RimI-like enzyme [Devosia sp. UYZn731]